MRQVRCALCALLAAPATCAGCRRGRGALLLVLPPPAAGMPRLPPWIPVHGRPAACWPSFLSCANSRPAWVSHTRGSPLPSAADAATALLWLPGGRLAVGAASGRLVCLQLSAELAAAQEAAAQSSAAALADGVARLQVAAAPEGPPAAAPMPAPAAAAPRPTPAAEASAAAVAAATAAAAAALARPGGRSPAAEGEGGLAASCSLPAAGPSTPRGQAGQEAAAGQYDLNPHGSGNGSGNGSGGSGSSAAADPSQTAFPPGRVPPPISLTRHSSEGSGSGGGGAPRRPRGARGGAGRSAAAPDAGGPGGGGGGPGGFSASLMHHIQAIRDNPPQQGHGRGHGHSGGDHQAAQLAGWGLGEPRRGARAEGRVGGAAGAAHRHVSAAAGRCGPQLPRTTLLASPPSRSRQPPHPLPPPPAGSPSGPSYVPWMVVPPQGPGGQPGGQAQMGGAGGGGGGPQGFAAFQAQAAMMQRMAMSQVLPVACWRVQAGACRSLLPVPRLRLACWLAVPGV